METIDSSVLDSTTGGNWYSPRRPIPINPHAPWGGGWPGYRPNYGGWWPGRAYPRGGGYWPWGGGRYY